MEKITHELWLFLTKISTLLALIFIGLIGKFSMMVLSGKKITFLQAVAASGSAFFIGVLSWQLCKVWGLQEKANFIVPFATLLSDKLIIIIFTFDWDKHLKKAMHDMLNYARGWFK